MAHDHHHPLTIDPAELTPGSVLVTIEADFDTQPVVATRRGIINAFSHEDGQEDQSLISPVEYVLSGLALSLSQTLKMVIVQKQLSVHRMFIATSQEREDGQTKITREIIVDGHLNDDDKELLIKAADNCPVQKILNGGISIETVMA